MAFDIFEKRNIAYFDIVSQNKFYEKPFVKQVCKFCETNNVKICTDSKQSETSASSIFGPHMQICGKSNKTLNLDDALNIQNEIIRKIGMNPIIFPTIIQQKDFTILFVLSQKVI